MFVLLALAQQTKATPHDVLVHPDQARREDDCGRNVHVEVVIDFLHVKGPEYDEDVAEKATEVDGHNLVPLERAREAAKKEHDHPGGERLVEVEVRPGVADRLPGREQPDEGKRYGVKVELKLVGAFVYYVQ